MAETKWTPGPWGFVGDPDSGTFTIAGKGGVGMVIARRQRPCPNAPESMANAELMTSAPDLYAALEPFAEQDECGIGVLVGEREEHTEQCDECQRILAARAALAKARGER